MSHDLLYLSLPLVPIVNAFVVLYFDSDQIKEHREEDENP